jgi:hypothetical protein
MKYYRLHIYCKYNYKTYNKITEILGITPMEFNQNENDENSYSLWIYGHNYESNEALYYDFINNFLDIIEPKFAELKKIGVKN